MYKIFTLIFISIVVFSQTIFSMNTAQKKEITYAFNYTEKDALTSGLRKYSDNYRQGIMSKEQVTKALDETKDKMVQDIEKMLERGQTIEILVDKTDNLNLQATTFMRASKKIKHKQKYGCFACCFSIK